MKPTGSGFAVASLVLGIVNIIILAIVVMTISYTLIHFNISTDFFNLSIIFAIAIAGLSFIFGFVAIRRIAHNSSPRGRGFALSGIWLGGLELCAIIIGYVVLVLIAILTFQD